MKRFLEDAIAGDCAVFWAFGIAVSTGLSFVGAANAIDRHFSIQDCTTSAIVRGENARSAHNNCAEQYENRHNYRYN